MSAAIFRSDGKTVVHFIYIKVSKPAFLIESRVGQMFTISDFRQATMYDFRPALWLGCLGQAARLGWAGLAGLGWARLG